MGCAGGKTLDLNKLTKMDIPIDGSRSMLYDTFMHYLDKVIAR